MGRIVWVKSMDPLDLAGSCCIQTHVSKIQQGAIDPLNLP